MRNSLFLDTKQLIGEKMITYSVNLDFDWDEADTTMFNLTVHEFYEKEDVAEILQRAHAILCNEISSENEPNYGRCHTCEHYLNEDGCCSNCNNGTLYVYYGQTLYEKQGKNPKTLLNYIHKLYPSWYWEEFDFDVNVGE
jgi:hypothetical protein